MPLARPQRSTIVPAPRRARSRGCAFGAGALGLGAAAGQFFARRLQSSGARGVGEHVLDRRVGGERQRAHISETLGPRFRRAFQRRTQPIERGLPRRAGAIPIRARRARRKRSRAWPSSASPASTAACAAARFCSAARRRSSAPSSTRAAHEQGGLVGQRRARQRVEIGHCRIQRGRLLGQGGAPPARLARVRDAAARRRRAHRRALRADASAARGRSPALPQNRKPLALGKRGLVALASRAPCAPRLCGVRPTASSRGRARRRSAKPPSAPHDRRGPAAARWRRAGRGLAPASPKRRGRSSSSLRTAPDCWFSASIAGPCATSASSIPSPAFAAASRASSAARRSISPRLLLSASSAARASCSASAE